MAEIERTTGPEKLMRSSRGSIPISPRLHNHVQNQQPFSPRRSRVNTGTTFRSTATGKPYPYKDSRIPSPPSPRTASTVRSTPASTPRSFQTPRRRQEAGEWRKVRNVNQERSHSGGSDSSGLPGEGYVIGGRRVERKGATDGLYNPNGRRDDGSAQFVWELLSRLAAQKDNKGNIELFKVPLALNSLWRTPPQNI